ncbi:mechanosensitive ion channel, partial [Candidatus Gracilibacteria bacterium]|nr:mechanosensitive ion channel [Candidatus Gracilibacteria bacterium]
IVTILIAFYWQPTLLVTSLGVISAAMVLALQEFISSFFAWFVIRIRGPYRKDDLIQIQTNVETYTGIVKKIGIFRTELKEKIGGSSLNREQFSGKIVDFPNNMILKHPVKNFTLDDSILWHNMDIVVTYESDYKLAGKVLEKILHDYFVFALDHKDIYLDDVYNLKGLYKPRIYFSLDEDGPCYTIWFATRTGKLREIVERISMEMLDEFIIHGIDIAYKTSRVIPTQDFDKPSKFYLTGQTET